MAIVVLKKFYETDRPTTSATPFTIATIDLSTFEGVNVSTLGRFVIRVDVEMFAFRNATAGVGSEAQTVKYYGILNTNVALTAIGRLATSTVESLGSSILAGTIIDASGTWGFIIQAVSNSVPNVKVLTRVTITIYDT